MAEVMGDLGPTTKADLECALREVASQRDRAVVTANAFRSERNAAEAQLAALRKGLQGEVDRLRSGPWAVKPTELADRLSALLDSGGEK
jgi:hypothetical protein